MYKVGDYVKLKEEGITPVDAKLWNSYTWYEIVWAGAEYMVLNNGCGTQAAWGYLAIKERLGCTSSNEGKVISLKSICLA